MSPRKREKKWAAKFSVQEVDLSTYSSNYKPIRYLMDKLGH